MDDWDPFSIDEGSSSVVPPEASAKEKTVESTTQQQSISEEEKSKLADALFEHFKRKELWDAPPDLRPDLCWHAMTATHDHWPHKDVKFERSDGIAYVTLNRPNDNNTIQETLTAGLFDAIHLLHRSKDIRVAVFTGEGRMFSAGGDPKQWQASAARARGEKVEGDGTNGYRIKMKQPGPNLGKHLTALCHRAVASGAYGECAVEDFFRSNLPALSAAKKWQTWALLPQFTICLLNGSAMAGGVGMACCCDYVIACKKAYVVVSEVRMGVIPATISPYVVAKLGAANAKRLFNTAENMKADRAKEVGIVDEVVENMAEGHKRIKEICKGIQSCAPEAVGKMKQLVFTCSGQPISEPIMCYTAKQSASMLKSEEAAAGRKSEISGEKKPWENVPITPLY